MPKPDFIEVVDTRTGSTFVLRLEVPLSIGRRPTGSAVVILDPADKTISSQHGVIEHIQGGLIYRDTSTNGTVIQGKRIKNSFEVLGDAFEIGIRNYRIRPVAANPLLVCFISVQNTVSEYAELMPGNYVSLMPPTGKRRLIRIQANMEPNARAIANFIHRGASIYLSRGDGHGVAINNRDAASDQIEVKAGDVVTIGGERVEILTHDMNRIVCGHATCRLLNPPQIHALCKWCGHDLANTNSVSRIFWPDEKPR